MILAYPLTEIGFPQCRIVKLNISYVTSLRRIQIRRYTSAGLILEEIMEDIVVVIDLSLLLVKWMVLSCQGGQH